MPRDWINDAQQRLGSGEAALTDALPAIIAKILRDGLWVDRTRKDGTKFASFRDFCEAPLQAGLNCPYDRMRAYCEHNKEARRLLAEEVPVLAGPGNPTGVNQHTGRNDGNANIPARDGTTATYTLRRLKRDHPELAQQVIDGELSAHAAAIAAGFRKPTWNAPDDVEELACVIAKRFPGWRLVRTSNA